MAHYQRVTRAQLNTRLQDRLGDGGVFWISAERDSLMNEALAVWQAMTGSWIEEFDIPTTAGEHYYDVPRQIMSLQRVAFNGVTELALISLHELDYGFPGWTGTTQDPPQFWAPIGLNKFVVYPAPESGFLHCEGIREASLLNSDADFIDVGDEELTRLILYAHHTGTFKEGSGEMEATQRAVPDLVQAAGNMNARLKATNLYRRALGLSRQEAEQPRTREPELGGRL